MFRKRSRTPKTKVPRRYRLKRFTPWIGGCFGGLFRFFLVVVVILLLGSIGSILIQDLDLASFVAGWRNRSGWHNLAPDILLSFWGVLRQSRRYYFIVTVGVIFSFVVGARYLRDVHDLESFGQGLRYLSALLFAFPYPSLEIEDGEPKISPGRENLLQKIGGPGFLIVQPGSVAILEGIDGTPKVCASGVKFVEPFMKIRQITKLEDRHGYIEGVIATTKDGIQIRVKDVHYRYRLRTGRKSDDGAGQDQNNPFPFSYQALLNMYYGRSVSDRGLTPWHQMVNFAVDGAITEYIRSNRFEEVSAPRMDAVDPRGEIEKRFSHDRTIDSLKRVGAELIWVDMGQFEIVDERIQAQLAEAWGAKWAGLTDVKRAYADAKRQSNLVTGRAEAQAAMLISILSVFDEIEDWADQEQAVRTIILASTAQILDGLAERDLLMPDGRSEELPPPM